MQTTRPLGISAAATFVRWGARLLSTGILLFWGWLLIAHVFSEEFGLRRGWLTRHGRWILIVHVFSEDGVVARGHAAEYISLTAMVISLLGLALSWKYELLGGLMALAAYVILGLVYWGARGGPYALWPITAVFFLSSWWMHRTAQRVAVTKTSGGSQ